MNALEQQVMEFALQGNHPVLEVLREQSAAAIVSSREFTGVGFFTNFSVPAQCRRLPIRGRSVIGDVYGEVEGLEYGAGFLVFVENGVLDFLECFIFEDRWPAEPQLRRLYYVHPKHAGSPALVETEQRDLSFALETGPPSDLKS